VKVLIALFLLFSISFSAVVSSEGEGCSSDIKKAKREALKNAKLNAVERHVGVLINSKTLVMNSKLMRDIIQTRVMGTVKLVGDPVFGEPKMAGKDQICVRVRADFEVPDESVKPADFGLVMMLSKKELRRLPNPAQETEPLKGKMFFPTKKMVSLGYKLAVFPLGDLPIPQREEVLFVCSKKKVKAFEEFFPNAFAEDSTELRKFLRTPYPKTVERFSEILTQLGVENYDMVDDFYVIY